MSRPPDSSPEFAAYFEMVVKTSKTRAEATSRLGYHFASAVCRHMKRLGIESPREWSLRPDVSLRRQEMIPTTVILTTEGRSWVGALLQGEGCIQSVYRKISDTTYLEVDMAMADPAPIFRLSEYFGLPRPSKPFKNHQWKPLWRKSLNGLRALRVLQEILPFLVGQKRKEAERAVTFFSPGGYHRGCFRNTDIWSQNEFQLRTKGGSLNQQSTNRIDEDRLSKSIELSQQAQIPSHCKYKLPEIIVPTLEGRCWVAALLQSEGCIASYYVKSTNSTIILLEFKMTDSAPIFKFSDYVGLPRPTRPKLHEGKKPAWRKEIYGRRAFRILQEVRPFLLGEKLREAEKALAFFNQDGYYRGHRTPIDIWPTKEFPLRRRRPASHE